MGTLRTQSHTSPSTTFHVNLGRLVSKLLVYALFLVLVVVALYPMVWIITNSLKTDIDLFESTWALPKDPLWGNYQRAWDYGIARYILNSALVTSVTTVVTVALSTMAAYALARFDFPGRTFWFLFILGGLMLAPQVALIPLFRTLVKLGIY